MNCAFNTKDCRVIPMTEEVSRNLTYFGISAKLAIAIESGKVDKEKVRTAIIAGTSPETLLEKAVKAPKVEEPVPAYRASRRQRSRKERRPVQG